LIGAKPNSLRVILFSPGMDGHRQVYVRAFADVLLSAGCRVCVVGDLSQGASRAGLVHLRPLFTDRRVDFLSTEDEPRNGLDVGLAWVRELVAGYRADVIVFMEADNHLGLLSAQAASRSRIPARRVGVFLRSTNYARKRAAHKSTRQSLSRLAHLPVSWRTDAKVFHEYLVPRFHVLDEALCLDEAFALPGRGYRWLPDIDGLSVDSEDQDESDREWLRRVDKLIRDSGSSRVVLYYGTPQLRRGYDLLVRLAYEVEGCFVHCGLPAADADLINDTHVLLGKLADSGRLFETREYIESFSVMRGFLERCRSVPLPYRRHLGSSGVMLQALRAGRPVIVDEAGLMGERVTKHHLGLTIQGGDFDELVAAFLKLEEMGASAFADDIADFVTHFSRQQVALAILAAAGLESAGAIVPQAKTEK